MNGKPSTPSGFTAHDSRGTWFAVISGTRTDAWAGLARAGLAALSVLYRAGLAVADLRWRLPGAVRRAACPVVSVGNLTVGGTGKTPMVAYLANLVTAMGGRPLIVSRGYGSRAGGPNEEALELERLAPGVPHVQDPDRLKAIAEWTTLHPCDVALLDDGFQHRRLARDLDIVLIDGLHPFSLGAADFGCVLPRGILREPLSALRRADLAVVTRTELIDAADLARLKHALAASLRPGTPVLLARHQPTDVILIDGSRRPIDWLHGQDVAAACGIGNPEAFRATLGQLGGRVRLFEAFRDHCAYARGDIDRLLETTRAAGLKTLVTTGKDFVKWLPLLTGPQPPPVDVAAVEIAVRMIEGEDVLRRRLGAILPGQAAPGDR